MKKSVKNKGNIEGWLSGGYCRHCGLPVTAFRITQHGRAGCVHSPATKETEAIAVERFGRQHRAEVADGEAAIWNER